MKKKSVTGTTKATRTSSSRFKFADFDNIESLKPSQYKLTDPVPNFDVEFEVGAAIHYDHLKITCIT